MIIFEPSPKNNRSPVPLCMAFHGNNNSAQAQAEFWRPLTSIGWLVALPQSSRAGNQPGTFIWNTPGAEEWNFQEVLDYFTNIKKKYQIDPSKVILSGFSMGGGLAIELALGGHIPCLGFLVVAPYIPYKYVDPNTNYADFIKTQVKRGYCVIGELDSIAVEGSTVLASRLPTIGVSCFVEQHPDSEHDFPQDFEQSLVKAVDYLSNSNG